MNRKIFIGPTPKNRVRVNSDEETTLRLLADYETVSLSEAFRIALREACRARGLWPLKKSNPVENLSVKIPSEINDELKTITEQGGDAKLAARQLKADIASIMKDLNLL
jgi:hypothetical protein